MELTLKTSVTDAVVQTTYEKFDSRAQVESAIRATMFVVPLVFNK